MEDEESGEATSVQRFSSETAEDTAESAGLEERLVIAAATIERHVATIERQGATVVQLQQTTEVQRVSNLEERLAAADGMIESHSATSEALRASYERHCADFQVLRATTETLRASNETLHAANRQLAERYTAAASKLEVLWEKVFPST